MRSEFLQPDTSNEVRFFHLAEASSVFLVHGIGAISGGSGAGDLRWFAALSPGCTWRRWRRREGHSSSQGCDRHGSAAAMQAYVGAI